MGHMSLHLGSVVEPEVFRQGSVLYCFNFLSVASFRVSYRTKARFPLAVLTGNGNWSPVNSASGNRA